jgi:hypothetical protein
VSRRQRLTDMYGNRVGRVRGVQFLSTPDESASSILEPIVRALSESDRANMSCAIRLPDSALGIRAEGIEEGIGVSSERVRIAADEIARKLNEPSLQMPLHAFVAARVSDIARAMRVRQSQVRRLSEFCHLRVKVGESGATPPHCDIYFIAFLSECLARVAEARFGNPDVCAACGQVIRTNRRNKPIALKSAHGSATIRIHRPQVCETCGTRSLRTYTAWVTLSALDTLKGARLQFAMPRMRSNLHDIEPAEVIHGHPRRGLSREWHDLDVVCGTGRLLAPGQGVLFDPRVLHRAVAGTLPELRVSMDLRFVIVPARRVPFRHTS